MGSTVSELWIRRRKQSSGFTLIETVVVLVLIGVISAFAVVRLGDVARLGRVRSTADTLVQNLAYARSRAMAMPTEVWALNYGASPSVLTRNGVAEVLPVSTPTPADVTVAGGNGSIIFNAFGAPDDQQIITVSGGSFSQTITVWAETGLIE